MDWERCMGKMTQITSVWGTNRSNTVWIKDMTSELAIQIQIWVIRFICEMGRASTVMVHTPEGPAVEAAPAQRKGA